MIAFILVVAVACAIAIAYASGIMHGRRLEARRLAALSRTTTQRTVEVREVAPLLPATLHGATPEAVVSFIKASFLADIRRQGRGLA